MATITKAYKETVPALRFIGKRYTDADRLHGMFGHKWGEWFQEGYFTLLENLVENLPDFNKQSIGLMREDENGEFEYWIGLFMPEGTPVPDNFAHVDFPAGELGVAWIYGLEGEVYMQEGEAAKKLEAEGISLKNSKWCFERYNCPRFTEPDSDGKIILDVCFVL